MKGKGTVETCVCRHVNRVGATSIAKRVGMNVVGEEERVVRVEGVVLKRLLDC